MSRRTQYDIPAGLKEAQQRFDEWRSSHTGRRPIPDPLWALAAELAVQHGVFRTAQVLRLDYTKLRQHTLSAAPAGKPAAVPTAAFVELMARPLARKNANASSKWKGHAAAYALNGKVPQRRTWLV